MSRQVAELTARWQRAAALAERADIAADERLAADIAAKLRYLEYAIAHVERTPARWFCPHCDGWTLDGVQYACLTHAEAILTRKVAELREEQGW